METLLLVDDEADVRSLARGALEDKGYRVLQAAGAEEALRVAAEHPDPIHLLVTDVVMPGGNGRELAARLVQQRPGMRVLYLSGFAVALSQHDMLQAGPGLEAGSPIIAKPFSVETLTQKVREVLDARPPSRSPFARRPREDRPDAWWP